MVFNKKKYYKEYYKKNKKRCIAYIKKYQSKPEIKLKIKNYQEEYLKRPEVKEKLAKNWKIRYKKYKQNTNYIKYHKLKSKLWARKHFGKYYKQDYKKHKEAHSRWRKKNKQQVKANHLAYQHSPLNNVCDICGAKIEEVKLTRHHWRYDKPLLVNTLCKTCHKIQHTKYFERYYSLP